MESYCFSLSIVAVIIIIIIIQQLDDVGALKSPYSADPNNFFSEHSLMDYPGSVFENRIICISKIAPMEGGDFHIWHANIPSS